jgi:AAA domain, putative AbiEii toxin, Type IV TA system
LEAAVAERTQNFDDLVWGRKGNRFELAIEAAIPDDKRPAFERRQYRTVRYEVRISLDSLSEDLAIVSEKVVLKVGSMRTSDHEPKASFPDPKTPPASVQTRLSQRNTHDKVVIHKDPAGKDRYYSEWATSSAKSPTFTLGPRKSALGNLPSDEKAYPVSNWPKESLSRGLQPLVLDGSLIKKASPPLRVQGFKPDGSNLPWVIDSFRRQSSSRFREWINHLRTALPDFEDIRVIERPDDRHRYLMLRYQPELDVPAWMVSDGTLRLLALTLPAYLQDFQGVYLIEEPENGIHPRAVETLF